QVLRRTLRSERSRSDRRRRGVRRPARRQRFGQDHTAPLRGRSRSPRRRVDSRPHHRLCGGRQAQPATPVFPPAETGLSPDIDGEGDVGGDGAASLDLAFPRRARARGMRARRPGEPIGVCPFWRRTAAAGTRGRVSAGGRALSLRRALREPGPAGARDFPRAREASRRRWPRGAVHDTYGGGRRVAGETRRGSSERTAPRGGAAPRADLLLSRRQTASRKAMTKTKKQTRREVGAKGLGLATLLLLAAACQRALLPQPIPLDRVNCARCAMLVSDTASGAEVVFTDSDPLYYDDVG